MSRPHLPQDGCDRREAARRGPSRDRRRPPRSKLRNIAGHSRRTKRRCAAARGCWLALPAPVPDSPRPTCESRFRRPETPAVPLAAFIRSRTGFDFLVADADRAFDLGAAAAGSRRSRPRSGGGSNLIDEPFAFEEVRKLLGRLLRLCGDPLHRPVDIRFGVIVISAALAAWICKVSSIRLRSTCWRSRSSFSARESVRHWRSASSASR